MQRFRPWFAGLALLSLVVVLAALLVAGSLSRGAQLVQLVQPTDAAVGDLFGTGGPGTPLGSPQVMIIRDPAAFLEGQTSDGARYVSDPYLKEHGIYPLQLKSVELLRNAVALGGVLALLLFGGLWWWTGRRRSVPRRAPTPSA